MLTQSSMSFWIIYISVSTGDKSLMIVFMTVITHCVYCANIQQICILINVSLCWNNTHSDSLIQHNYAALFILQCRIILWGFFVCWFEHFSRKNYNYCYFHPNHQSAEYKLYLLCAREMRRMHYSWKEATGFRTSKTPFLICKSRWLNEM